MTRRRDPRDIVTKVRVAAGLVMPEDGDRAVEMARLGLRCAAALVRERRLHAEWREIAEDQAARVRQAEARARLWEEYARALIAGDKKAAEKSRWVLVASRWLEREPRGGGGGA